MLSRCANWEVAWTFDILWNKIKFLQQESFRIIVNPKTFKFDYKRYKLYLIKCKPRFSGNPDLRDKSLLTHVSRKSGFDCTILDSTYSLSKCFKVITKTSGLWDVPRELKKLNGFLHCCFSFFLFFPQKVQKYRKCSIRGRSLLEVTL